MRKEFYVGQLVLVLFAYHDCDLADASDRFAVDPFDTNIIYGKVNDNGSEDDYGNWGAVIELESDVDGEFWLDQKFIVTENDARFESLRQLRELRAKKA